MKSFMASSSPPIGVFFGGSFESKLKSGDIVSLPRLKRVFQHSNQSPKNNPLWLLIRDHLTLNVKCLRKLKNRLFK